MSVHRMNLGGDTDCPVYKIMNKDVQLGTFRWDTYSLVSLVENNGLPEFIPRDLQSWIDSRTPPKHRAYMYELLDLLQLKSAKAILDYSRGLALTDTLWVAPVESDLHWQDVNLFDNEFDEVIAKTAFDGGMYGLPFSTTSPEFSTDGMLPKCWVRETDDSVWLYKGGTDLAYNAGYEPYSEVMSSQVLAKLCYPHVRYMLKNYHGRVVSRCPLFTTQDVMLLPVHRYFQMTSFYSLWDTVMHLGFAAQLAEYLVFDFLSVNPDRHVGNIGVLLDANTFEFKGFAPIYDNGMAWFAYLRRDTTLEEEAAECAPALYTTFEDGVYLAKKLSRSYNVERLINFKFDRSELLNVSGGKMTEERLQLIEDWLQKRVQEFLEM